MADTEQVRDAGRRLATDLRELREEREIDADAILEATRLSADILESFDETALVDHPAFNRVYLRSIVSSYARVLEIEEPDVLAALDQALNGRYHGALRKKYLEAHLPEDGPSFALVEDIEEVAKAAPSDPEPQPTPVEAEETVPEAEPEPGPAVGKTSRVGTISVVSVAVLAALAILLWLLGRNRTSDNGGSQEPVVTDTVRAPAPPPEPEWIPLGDSIRFDVIALAEPLDPIRVKVDRDLRRPYWVEHQDTLTFYAADSILFERELDHAAILLDSYRLSDSLVASDGVLRMTRSRARTWLDSLAVRRALDR